MSLGVLVFGQREDPHVAVVQDHLRVAGVDVLIFDQYRDQTAITYTPQGARWPFEDWVARHEGVVVWPRVKLPQPGVRPEFEGLFPRADDPVGPYQTKEHFRSEWRLFSRALVRALMCRHAHVQILNEGLLTEEASLKALQLDAAAAVGMHIPHTVIGNAEAIIEANFGDRLLYKPLGSTSVGGIGLPPPAMLAKAEVLAEGRATVCPAIFQARVAKTKELRVHVAGDAVIVIDIDSQSIEQAKLDWRAAQMRREIYSIGSLPGALSGPLKAYMSRFKLDVGVFDFAVDPDGQCVFFECNPEGQWLWMERITGAPISQDVARALVARAQAAANAGRGHVAPA